MAILKNRTRNILQRWTTKVVKAEVMDDLLWARDLIVLLEEIYQNLWLQTIKKMIRTILKSWDWH